MRTVAMLLVLVCLLGSCSSITGILNIGDDADQVSREGRSERRIPLPPMVDDFPQER